MSYNDDEPEEEKSFGVSDSSDGVLSDDLDESLETLSSVGDFGYEEEDPDKDH